jgi:hypothetical protein
MRLCVEQSQCGAPRAAGDDPAFDAQVLAQLLDVGDQLWRVVVPQGTGSVASGVLRPQPRWSKLIPK